MPSAQMNLLSAREKKSQRLLVQQHKADMPKTSISLWLHGTPPFQLSHTFDCERLLRKGVPIFSNHQANDTDEQRYRFIAYRHQLLKGMVDDEFMSAEFIWLRNSVV
ncbi:MAG: hypothetical protein NZ937_09755 [Armatimonadetes bacterium]|nr:hypothetical protein [Armatimonadota bacterium]